MMLEKAGEVCLPGTVWKGVVASVLCPTAWPCIVWENVRVILDSSDDSHRVISSCRG